MYNLDLAKFVRRLLPWFLVSDPAQRAWVETLLVGTAGLLAQLRFYRSGKLLELSYSGQTIQLERYLNDSLDPASKRIKIQHFGDDPDFDYLKTENGAADDFDYLLSENQPVTAPQGFFYFTGEQASAIGSDFIVLYPADLGTASSKIASHVDKYRLAGRRYSVQLS